MLDELGLPAALRWYLSGFGERTGIDVELVVPEDLGRLSTAMEMDMFRIVQECLMNVHRHSGSRTALVKLELETDRIVLKVEDSGRGMPINTSGDKTSRLFGVGLSGMRQRLRHLGGRLEIASSSCGTRITAIVPK